MRSYADADGTRPLRIGVFGARGIPSTYSGYETFLTVLLPELARRGHNVTMYCRRGEVPPGGDYNGVRRVVLPSVRSKQLATPLHGLIAGAAARPAGHEVLLVVNVANALWCLLLRLSGQRTVLNTDGQEWLREKWGRVGRSVFLGSAHLVRWAVSAAVSDCRAMHDIYGEQFGVDSTVIPYCWTAIEPVPEADLLARRGIRPRGYVLVAGRLVPENGIARIVRAYLRTALPQPIVVLGRANYRSPDAEALAVMAQTDSRVVLAGHVDDRAQFAALVRDAQVYVHGHSVGGMNPSLVEAMGVGARILSFSTKFNRETLADAGDYFDRPETDLGAAIEAVVAGGSSVDTRRREAGTRRARSQFSLAAVADAYELLLRQVAGTSVLSRSTRLRTTWDQPTEHAEAT